MNKWVVIAVSFTVVIGVLFLVAGRNNTTNTETLGYTENDAEVPNGQSANLNEKVDLSQTKSNMQKPELTIDSSKTYSATLKTTEGDIVVELNAKDTPITANNFVYLAENNFYDNTIFHRVINGFMIQGGDPQGTGMGDPGYKFEDEPVTGDYSRGTIAMANSGPNTNGSQFFIMHKDYPLPKNYVIFGKVVEGIEVVDKIAEAEVKTGPSGESSSPVNPVTVQSVTVSSN